MGNGRVWLILLFTTSLVILYLLDPEKGSYPSCPFRLSTGLLCPGCGSLRALHDLTHLRFAEAFMHNAFLLLAIPLTGMQLIHNHLFIRRLSHPTRRKWLYLWLSLIIGWGVLRNVYVGPCTGH